MHVDIKVFESEYLYSEVVYVYTIPIYNIYYTYHMSYIQHSF